MPLWILIVLVAQFLNAIVALVDKHIVSSRKVGEPIVYAFFVSLLSVLALLIYFAGFLQINLGEISLPQIQNVAWPSLDLMILSVLSGIAFLFALFFSYSALQRADASDVVPVVGSASAIGTFIFSSIFLGEVLTQNFFYGFVLLVVGMVLLSHFRFTLKVFLMTIVSGSLFASYFVVIKHLFNELSFDHVFFWTRVGMLVVVILLFLLIPKIRAALLVKNKRPSINAGFWVIGNNILGGLVGIALLKATEIGSVTLVQAMNSFQFAFLVIFSFLFGRITPVTFGENNTLGDVLQKFLSVSLIIGGFYLLFR